MSEEFGPNFITLTDEDGNDIELEYVDALELDGQTYMAFFPVVEDDASYHILHAVYYSEQAAGYAVDDAEQRQERAG